MEIKKRSLPVYILLNCLTLGIYGFVVSMQVGDEINAICAGDDEEPKFGYAGAVMFRAIAPVIGIIVGLIVSLVATDSLVFSFFGEAKAAIVFAAMAVGGLLFAIIGSIFSGIYLKYWWYKQANRLKLNANRYGLEVKEGGTDNFLFHTIFEVFVLPITAILLILSIAIPALIVWLITLADSEGALVFASVLAFIFSLPILFFGVELTTGSNFAMFFIFKNLNRFADVYANGAQPFDKMAYEYYPSHDSFYPEFLSNIIKGGSVLTNKKEEQDEPPVTVPVASGSLFGLKGSCASYKFELTPGEQFIIGKDAKVSNIVIDPAYKEISRKHVGVTYNPNTDTFLVVDYSSNGTWANDIKLTPGEGVMLPKGTILKLANDKNTFRLE